MFHWEATFGMLRKRGGLVYQFGWGDSVGPYQTLNINWLVIDNDIQRLIIVGKKVLFVLYKMTELRVHDFMSVKENQDRRHSLIYDRT